MIEKNIIVIKREGDKLLFPTLERKEVDVPDNTPSKQFIMCRIDSYDSELGKMILKTEADNVGFDAYVISIEVNAELLSPLIINEVFFVERRSISPVLQNTIPKGAFSPDNWTKSPQENPSRPEPVKLDAELLVKHIGFLDGKVSFEHHIQIAGKKVAFYIYNTFIKKEHDSIKNYFPQALKADKFAISIEFEYLGNEILNPTCSSPHIAKIDANLFELVEDMYITDYIVNSDFEKIYSLSQLALDAATKTGSENMLDPDMLLKKIITPDRTKHYYHLRYLSDKHLANNVNIYVTGKPLSFIFLLTNGNGYYLVWETYSTEEATYVWKIPGLAISQLESELNRYVGKIKWLRANNKMSYLKTKPENFKRIEHEYANGDMGFNKWKIQLNEFMALIDKL